jgi:hypothetical protein
VWCGFARDIAAAATARDMTFFEEQLLARPTPCQRQPSLPEGCDATTESVLALPSFQYGTDCCYVSPQTFLAELLYGLDQVSIDAPAPVAWEPYAIIRDSQFWTGDVSILIRSAAPTAGVIEFGVRQEEGRLRILGMIRGTMGTLYVFPEADFREIR